MGKPAPRDPYPPHRGPALSWVLLAAALTAATAAAEETSGKGAGRRASGPLRAHPTNGRYFTDGTRDAAGAPRAVYLTGSHTWPNLIDRGPTDPPPAFDFDEYLDFLSDHEHNFIRLWARHVTWYHDYGDKRVLHARPLAWPRTGPGNALDGKPKFDLSRFDDTYFARLRDRVKGAGDRGLYVGVMLFGGCYECTGGWRGNPFNAANNINGIDGDPDGDGQGLEHHTLDLPAVNRVQEAYVRKVVDTVNGFDNVLYEISNEGDATSKAWQAHLVRLIKQYEASKPKQHPVGMTAVWDGDNEALYAGGADWVSPLVDDKRVVTDLPAADGRRVSLLDSDHWFILKILGNADYGRDWVWMAFCRGHNPILMEQVPDDSGSEVPVTTDDPGHAASRRAMGVTRNLSLRVNLAAMAPQSSLASTGYCLASPGAEYVVYQPAPGKAFSVTPERGSYDAEWVHPTEGVRKRAGRRDARGARLTFEPPFDGAAVLHLRRRAN